MVQKPYISQPCWSNDSLVAALVANTLSVLRANPTTPMIMVDQMDGNVPPWLIYPPDHAANTALNSTGGAMFLAVNEVAKAVESELVVMTGLTKFNYRVVHRGTVSFNLSSFHDKVIPNRAAARKTDDSLSLFSLSLLAAAVTTSAFQVLVDLNAFSPAELARVPSALPAVNGTWAIPANTVPEPTDSAWQVAL